MASARTVSRFQLVVDNLTENFPAFSRGNVSGEEYRLPGRQLRLEMWAFSADLGRLIKKS